MPEPEDTEHHVERRVIYESATSTRSSAITIAVVVVIAIALIVWIVMQMR
jgi:t-SNARE complex subunit (syntaxin)